MTWWVPHAVELGCFRVWVDGHLLERCARFLNKFLAGRAAGSTGFFLSISKFGQLLPPPPSHTYVCNCVRGRRFNRFQTITVSRLGPPFPKFGSISPALYKCRTLWNYQVILTKWATLRTPYLVLTNSLSMGLFSILIELFQMNWIKCVENIRLLVFVSLWKWENFLATKILFDSFRGWSLKIFLSFFLQSMLALKQSNKIF